MKKRFSLLLLCLAIISTACVAPVIHEDIEDKEVIYDKKNNPLRLYDDALQYGYQHTPSVFFIPPNHTVKNAFLKIDVQARRPAGRDFSLLYIKFDDRNIVIPSSDRTGKGDYDLKGEGVIFFDVDDGRKTLILDLSELEVAEHDPGVQGMHKINWIPQLTVGRHSINIWLSDGENSTVSAELRIEY